MLVSMVDATLMSPFSSSKPHSAMAPSDDRKPSCGITRSIAIVSSSFVLLLTTVTRSTRAPPRRADQGEGWEFVLLGDEHEARLAVLLLPPETHHLLAEVHRRLPL